ncbi:MAG: hypothetical protein QG583_322 [Patescibacteria group bacterium]|nr:hypothetical protein [Patescibacteria group bacterium]
MKKYYKKIKLLFHISIVSMVIIFFSSLFLNQAWAQLILVCPPGQTMINNICYNTIDSPDSDTPLPNSPAGQDQNIITSDTTYTLLAPIGEFTTFDVKDGKCPFGRYMNLMISIFMGIAAVLAMLMIIIGGLEYMTNELASAKESGKHKITQAVLGLLLALAAYLILNTINPNLLNLCFHIEEAKIYITENPDVPHDAVDGRYCTDPSYVANINWDDKIAVKKELPSGVGVNNGECQTVGQLGCTSTRGLDLSIIKKVERGCGLWRMAHLDGGIQLTYSCDGITVTGGTECWAHSRTTNHKPGSSTVDLRYNEPLNSYLKAQKFLGNNSKGEPRYRDRGVVFTLESKENADGTITKHWHAQE